MKLTANIREAIAGRDPGANGPGMEGGHGGEQQRDTSSGTPGSSAAEKREVTSSTAESANLSKVECPSLKHRTRLYFALQNFVPAIFVDLQTYIDIEFCRSLLSI
jgi:hypothetical protein